MDYYDLYEPALSEEHDYNVCMANCQGRQDCNCNHSQGDDALGWLILGLTIIVMISPFIIYSIVDNIQWRLKYSKKQKLKENKITKDNSKLK